MVSCFDAKTGRQFYDRERLGRGTGGFNASPIAYNGNIYCFSERGHAVAVKAGEKFEISTVNELGEMIMATPSVAGDRLLVRTTGHLFCIRDGAKAKPKTGGLKVASVIGKWNAKATTNEGEVLPSVVTILERDGKLTGESRSDRGGVGFDSVKFAGGKVEIDFVLEIEGNRIPVRLAAVHDGGNQLKGRWIILGENEAEVTSGPWEAARQAPPTPKLALEGKWNTLAKTDEGESKGQIGFEKRGDGYIGRHAGGGEFKVNKVEGNDISFEFPFGEGTVVINAVHKDGKLVGGWTYYDKSDIETASDYWVAERAE